MVPKDTAQDQGIRDKNEEFFQETKQKFPRIRHIKGKQKVKERNFESPVGVEVYLSSGGGFCSRGLQVRTMRDLGTHGRP